MAAGWIERTARWFKRRPITVALLATAALAVVVLVVTDSWDMDSAKEQTETSQAASPSLPVPQHISGPDEFPVELLVILLAIGPVFYLSSWLHEFGHFVLARWVGFTVSSFGMGLAWPLWVGNWGDTRVYLCLRNPFQGITFILPPRLFSPRRHLAAFFAGGILANTVAGLLCLLLWQRLPWGSFWLMTAAVNCFLAFTNLIPFSFRVGNSRLRSDGGQILALLRGTPRVSPAEHLQLGRGLRILWEAVGDRRVLCARLLGSAGVWADLGVVEQASRLCEEAEVLGVPEGSLLQALAALVRSDIARQTGNCEDSARELDSAAQTFRSLGDGAGLALVELGRAELLAQQGDASAFAAMDSPALRELEDRQPAVHAALTAVRVAAGVAQSNAEQVEAFLVEYERTRTLQPSDPRDLRVYRTLGRFHAGRQEEVQAESAYQQALEAARRFHQALADPADRQSFVSCHQSLLTEVQAWWQQQGKADEAARLEKFFPTDEELQREKAEADRLQNQRTWRRAWRVELANVAVATFLVILALVLHAWADSPRLRLHGSKVPTLAVQPTTAREWLADAPLILRGRLGERWAMIPFLFVFFFLMFVMVALVFWIAGRLVPRVRGVGGLLGLLLALLPWLMALPLLLLWDQ